MFFLGSIIFTTSYIFFYGKIITIFIFKNKKLSVSEIGIYGSIILSFFALLLNFVFPLNKTVCTIVFIIPLFFIFKKNFLSKNDILFILIASILAGLILAYSKINTPDAGLYHLPYIQTINENKIIIGLGNIHFRFAHISILQYLSAINFNLIFGVYGILIPTATLVSFCLIYFVLECHKTTKISHVYTLRDFFNLGVLIYFIYKINRYSGFGNDAIAHLLFFYLISIFLKEDINYKALYKTTLISIFVFLNKITLGLSFLIPFYLFIKSKRIYLKIFFSFPVLFLIIWLIKNFLVSGCLIFPLEITCSKKVLWSNHNQVIIQSLSGEAWSKGWPDRKKTLISQKEFVKKFNWLNAWSDIHLKYILKIIIPFIIFLLILVILINYFKVEKFRKFKLYGLEKQKIFYLFVVLIISNFMFFVKFPLYRYGYSYLITLLIFLFSLFIFRCDDKFLNKLFKYMTVICLIIFSLKQFTRIEKNYSNRDIWPNIYSFLPKKSDVAPQKIKISDNFYLYTKKNECLYNSFKFSPCTNYHTLKLKHKKILNYNIIFLQE